MAEEIGALKLAERLRSGAPLRLVDVREGWEREIAAIPGDLHIPMNEVPARIAEFAPPAGGTTVVYCHAGVRSLTVAVFLERNGLQGVLSLSGGIDAWAVEVDPALPRY
jgi:rhodanese-related sulfurtransferase